MSDDSAETARSRPRKAATAFRTISEVADDLQIPQHVLRFWETKFPQLKPLKRGGGRRYYRPEDIALLRRISDLLYTQGYTIKGVQRLLRDGGMGHVQHPRRLREAAKLGHGGKGAKCGQGREGAPIRRHVRNTNRFESFLTRAFRMDAVIGGIHPAKGDRRCCKYLPKPCCWPPGSVH